MKNYSIILFVIFLLIFSVFSYAFIDPNLIYLHQLYSGFAFENRLLTTSIYVCSICIFFIFYFSFLNKVNKGKLKGDNFKKIVTVSIIILLFAYPAVLSYDIFNYIFTAKVLFFYHENPYLIMPIAFIGDPLLLFTHAANKIALYGPIWILLTGIPCYGGKILGFISILLSFKLFTTLFYIGTTFIIWKISRSLSSVYLFALNPLVLIETIVSGHNDIVMMFLALFSFFLLSKNKFGLGILFFILSIFIKYATLFLLPIFIYVLIKKIKKDEVKWEKIFYYSSLLMVLAVLLSPIREELYPWYAIWFLPFIYLIPQNKALLYFSFSISFGLLLRYVPFMLLGTYFGPTPLIKQLVTFIPVILVLIFILIKEKLWSKIFFR